jgi:hypothetical protein
VFEAKFMLPLVVPTKHMAQLQHNMWVTNAAKAAAR